MAEDSEKIPSKIWLDEPSPKNPFCAEASFCHGYDVYNDILKNARWSEYLFLMFQGERPTQNQSILLEKLAITLAHPGLRDHSVRAAMTSGTGGSGSAASLMAALAVGAGNLGGAREIYHALQLWKTCASDITLWKRFYESTIDSLNDEREDVWQPMEHMPGFDPNGDTCGKPIIEALNHMKTFETQGYISWLSDHREDIESLSQSPLSMTGVAAAVFHDLGFNENQAEMLFLLLRLPGAAVQALERQDYGWRHYPFFAGKVHLSDKKHVTEKKS